MPLWTYLEQGGKRAVAVWHRRAGKDSVALNWCAVAAHQRVGNYWHMLPEAKQARKAIWNGIDRQGRRIIDQVFPKAIRTRTVDDEMMIALKCGSTWQVLGSDTYNSNVGSNPVGVVFSEYSLSKPAAWDYIRPILKENGGWAAFIYTPRGKNHGKRMLDIAMREPGWFAELLGVDQTNILTPEDIEDERREGMSEEMIQQEYYVSFEGAVEGAYYAKELAAARKQHRILPAIPYVQSEPVNTFWDLGANDTTAIWLHQYVAMQHRFIKCHEKSGEPLAYFAKWLKEQPYHYGTHYLPHDAAHERLGLKNNDSNKKMLEKLLPGHKFEIVPRIDDVLVGIQLTRDRFSECWFDGGPEGCEAGLDALGAYRKEWDEKTLTFKRTPKHDWSSNYADAFRQFAQGWKAPTKWNVPKVAPPHMHDRGMGY